jgi:hypothetical protein
MVSIVVKSTCLSLVQIDASSFIKVYIYSFLPSDLTLTSTQSMANEVYKPYACPSTFHLFCPKMYFALAVVLPWQLEYKHHVILHLVI